MSIIKLCFLCTLFIPLLATAEYNGHQIEFNLELTNGKMIKGYNYLPDVYQKDRSQDYTDFLEAHYELVLKNPFEDQMGSYAYFEKRIKYEYTLYDENPLFIFTLIDKKSIDLSTIKSFKIIRLIPQSYLINVSSTHQWKDRKWMQKPTKNVHSFGGTFCSNDVFIHKKNKKTEKLIEALEKKSKDLENELQDQYKLLRNTDGEPKFDIEEKIDQLEEEMDDKIYDLIAPFHGMKVVVITMCTC